jgi:hypothetical protein
MLVPAFPFDYARLIDAADRVRRAQARPCGSRVRRANTGDGVTA